MEQTILTKVKRAPYEGFVAQVRNQYFAVVIKDKEELKRAGPYFDQDEAEIELGSLIDTVWRETALPKSKLVRRV